MPSPEPSLHGPDPRSGPGLQAVGPERPSYVRIGVVAGEELAHARTLPSRAADEPDSREIMVCAPLRGGLLLAPERGGLVTPGSLVLADSAAPVMVSGTAGCALAVLSVPRRLVPFPDDALARTTGWAYDASTGVASLLHPLLLSLATAEGSWGTEEGTGGMATRLWNQAADLLTSLVAEEAERDARPGESGLTDGDRRAADEIRRWVNSRLPDPRLRPDAIAEAHHMSVRRLHKLFAGENGTIGRWIQRRRLEECRRELGRGGSGVKVQAVAQRWGFATAAHFSRCFRARYGMSPTEWRDQRAENGSVEPTTGTGALKGSVRTEALPSRRDHQGAPAGREPGSVLLGRVVGQCPGDPGPGGDSELGKDLVQMRSDGTR